MDDLDPLLIGKKEPWFRKTRQSMIEIGLISFYEHNEITDKFKEFFQKPKRNLNSQFYMKNKTKIRPKKNKYSAKTRKETNLFFLNYAH